MKKAASPLEHWYLHIPEAVQEAGQTAKAAKLLRLFPARREAGLRSKPGEGAYIPEGTDPLPRPVCTLLNLGSLHRFV